MEKIEEFNSWIDTNIPVVSSKDFSDKIAILDWIMQKGWSKSLEYISYPDEQVHTVYEGLREVFEFVDMLYSHINKVKCIYNQKLYTLMMNHEESISERKLKQIEKILSE